jgi:hypothetical protein
LPIKGRLSSKVVAESFSLIHKDNDHDRSLNIESGMVALYTVIVRINENDKLY